MARRHPTEPTRHRAATGPLAIALVVAASVASLLVTSCSRGSESHAAPDRGPRPLTAAEAQLLATARVRTAGVGVHRLEARLTDGHRTMSLRGWIDFGTHAGYVRTEEHDASGTALGTSLLTWNLTTVAARPSSSATGVMPPLPLPADGWSQTQLDPSATYLGRALALAVNLGADRPENPKLLQESSARWLRSSTLHGRPVQVVTGPDGAGVTGSGSADRLRYWISSRGIERLQVRLGQDVAASPWSSIDLSDTDTEPAALAGPLASTPSSSTATPSATPG